MFKIGEFSQLVRVSPRMLRHYEKCGLLYPAEIDPYTGYRQYSAGQIALLSRITALREKGSSIEHIGDILAHWDDIAYRNHAFSEQSAALRRNIEADEGRLKKLMEMSGTLQKEKTIMLYEVELKKLDAVKVLSLRGTIPQYNQESLLWEKLGRYIGEHQIACHNDGYSTYYDEEYKDSNPDVGWRFRWTSSARARASSCFRSTRRLRSRRRCAFPARTTAVTTRRARSSRNGLSRTATHLRGTCAVT